MHYFILFVILFYIIPLLALQGDGFKEIIVVLMFFLGQAILLSFIESYISQYSYYFMIIPILLISNYHRFTFVHFLFYSIIGLLFLLIFFLKKKNIEIPLIEDNKIIELHFKKEFEWVHLLRKI